MAFDTSYSIYQMIRHMTIPHCHAVVKLWYPACTNVDHLQDRHMHQCWTRSTRTIRIKLRVGSDIYKKWVNVHGLKGEFVLTHGFKIGFGLVNKKESRFVWGGTWQAMVKVFT